MTERPCVARPPSSASARRPTTVTARRPTPNSNSRCRRWSNACKDAGISPHDIDGFASYGNDRSEAGRLAAALGIKELRFSNMFWGGGGGGVCGAVGNAAAAVATGMADCVVAFRSLAQGQFARYGRGTGAPLAAGDDQFLFPYGVMSPAQRFAMKVTRFMHDHGIRQEALRAISLACYHHAQNNPNAVMRGRPLTEEKYDDSRWIIEPFFHLYDCCQENDGAAAVIVVPADRAQRLPAQAILPAGLRAGLRTPQRRAGAQHAELSELAFHASSRRGFTTWRSCRRPISASCSAMRTSPAGC